MDSATAVLHEAIRVAGTDTAYAGERKEALAGVARSSLRRAQTNPAVQQWQRARYSRDSLGRGITHDSLILARMQASAASRRTRGARLSPADQRTFSADSAARAQALAQGQAARVQLTERVGRDSAAVEAALSPAIAAYRDYLATYPTDLEAVTTLSALYSQNGRPTAAAATFDTFFTHSGEIDPEVLFEAGQRLLAGNLLTPSIKAFTLGLERNPWNRNALSSLATAYLGLRDTSNALATTRRLVGLEPLSRSTLRQHATALDLRGRRDSAQRYLALADSTLPVDVTVGSFVPDSGGYVLTGIATNLRSTASQPLRLTFEFLDATGGTRASQTTEIPAIAGTQGYQFQVRVSGTGIVGWRYRPS
jgi:tetratricopeptide (TPR) repeat protein